LSQAAEGFVKSRPVGKDNLPPKAQARWQPMNECKVFRRNEKVYVQFIGKLLPSWFHFTPQRSRPAARESEN